MTEPRPALAIDVWSDYVCPFCYLEEPVLSRVKETFGDAVELRWRAFELRRYPTPTLDPKSAYLETIWANSVYPMAQQRGMRLLLPPVQPVSRKAFEAVEHARRAGRFDAMHRALFRAFFEHGRDIGAHEVLIDVGMEAGVEPQPLRDALERGTYTQHVIDDERQAETLAISGVPTMTLCAAGSKELSGRITGAQPYAEVAATIERLLEGVGLS